MKINMHLFCLIVALAASVTDGRISSSSSSLSSSSQPGVGGSAVDMTPNRRDLQPALGTHYCTVTDVGQRRGVVVDQCHKCEGGQKHWPCNDKNLCAGFCTPEAVCDEQIRAADLQPALVDSKLHYCTVTDVGQRSGVVDQCHKCEGGQKHWPCNDENLCAGFCTPEAVCKERLKVVAAKTVETAASDCATVIAEKEDLEDLMGQKKELIATLENENDSLRACIVDCVDGYERGTDVTCTEACAGQCCGITGDRKSGTTDTCAGFTGLINRDDSCTGNGAFTRKDTIIAEKDEEIDDQKKLITIYTSFLDAIGLEQFPFSLCGFALQFDNTGVEDAATLLDCTTSPTASPIKPPTCGVDSYLFFGNCQRCDVSPGYGTSTCGIFGATSNDQCKYPIGTCVYDVIKEMMVFGEDIPIEGIFQGNSCDTQALQQYTCGGGKFYDPRDDCPEANTKEDFDACGAECIWTTTETEQNGPERLCIRAEIEEEEEEEQVEEDEETATELAENPDPQRLL